MIVMYLSKFLRDIRELANIIMRYDNTSRLGVVKTDSIVTEKLGWIFREQPIADVGLDAIIEQVENGNPTGKFIAVQIKTGKGNFYINEKTLTHYVSNIHYNYWLDLCIPIIMVAHLPDENETYWEEISPQNFKKSKKRWKIEIPRSQKFNENSKNRLTKILALENDTNFEIYTNNTTLNDYYLAEDIGSLSDASQSLFAINDTLVDQTDHTRELNAKLKTAIESKLNSNSPQVVAAWRNYTHLLRLTSAKLEGEVTIFSEAYSRAMFAMEVVIMKLKQDNVDLLSLDIDISLVNTIPESIDTGLFYIQQLKQTISELSLGNSNSKDVKKQYVETLDLIVFEMSVAKQITENFIAKTNS